MFPEEVAIINVEITIKNMSTKAKLTCSLSGQTRQSSHKYIAKKADQNGISSEEFQQYYTAKPAYLEFKQALIQEGVEAVLTTHNLTEDTADKILMYNGKSKKTLQDFQTAPASSTTELVQETDTEQQVELATA